MEFDAATIFLMLGCFLLDYFIDNLIQLLIGSEPLTSEEYAVLERNKVEASKKDIERRLGVPKSKKRSIFNGGPLCLP
jgi:hypothetical protein